MKNYTPTFDEFINEAKSEKRNFEVITDTDDLYIAVPHSHAASRKLGQSKFMYKGRSSKWPITRKSPDAFNRYYLEHEVTFYFIKAKGENIEKLKEKFPKEWEGLTIVAITSKNGKLTGYTGDATMISSKDLSTYLKILELEGNF